MNVIFLYAQAKDNLNKEEALEVCRLYMNGLKYKDAVNKVKKVQIETVLKGRRGGDYSGR